MYQHTTMYSLRYYIDSWIEVSSQPSSSSLSSATTSDDIITTGLRVQHTESLSYQSRSRRRRLHHLAGATAQVDYSPRETGSSQDEYEESESESDRVLSSSNEDITRQPLDRLVQPGPSSTSDAAPSSDDDDASTALGLRISSSPFVPQPNAFSHPPATQDPSWTRAIDTHRSQPNVLPKPTRRTTTRRSSTANTRSARRQQQHSPYNMISPSHHADHDAALRASLSTLLSCAAAARGLPKSDPQPSPQAPRMQPSSFRFVPESVAMGEESDGEDPSCAGANASASAQQPSSHTVTAAPVSKTKRRSSSSRDRCCQRPSVSKKSRRASLAESSAPASPTIMTWVISAGVVVLFSAISFSAGYMLGREVGKTEAGAGFGSVFGDGASSGRTGCGRETVKGSLKRLRWGTAAASSGIMS